VPEGSTGAVDCDQLFWALGYNQMRLITRFDPVHVEIDPNATIKRPSGVERRSHATI
jgi:hypothetical protein